MPTKIIHLITSLEGGGTENFLSQILAHSPTGYDHQVLYLKKDGVIGERIRRSQISVRPAGSLWTLYQTLRKESPDILHTCLYSAHIVGRILGNAAGVPAIITSQRAIDIWQKPWQTVIDRWTLPLSHAVIVNSHAAAEVIDHRRRDPLHPKLFEIPNGVDGNRFKSIPRSEARQRVGLPVDAVVGGALMRLHSEKGADFIPDFAAQLLPDNPRLHLLIGGVGPFEKMLKERLSNTAYTDRIHWIGWVEDTPGFLSACDFFWSLSREESFPQTLVETSSLGLPWVAPETGGVPELLQAGAAGQVFQRLNIPDAAEKTRLMIKDLPTMADLAQKAIPQIRVKFSLDKMIKDVYAVFERGKEKTF